MSTNPELPPRKGRYITGTLVAMEVCTHLLDVEAEAASVAFGTLGQGTEPNLQVRASGLNFIFDGTNFMPYPGAITGVPEVAPNLLRKGHFLAGNLTRFFTHIEMCDLLGECPSDRGCESAPNRDPR